MDQSGVSTILSGGTRTTMFDISPGVLDSTPVSLDISTKHLPGLIDLVSMHPCAGALHQRSPRFAQYTHQYKLDTILWEQADLIV